MLAFWESLFKVAERKPPVKEEEKDNIDNMPLKTNAQTSCIAIEIDCI